MSQLLLKPTLKVVRGQAKASQSGNRNAVDIVFDVSKSRDTNFC